MWYVRLLFLSEVVFVYGIVAHAPLPDKGSDVKGHRNKTTNSDQEQQGVPHVPGKIVRVNAEYCRNAHEQRESRNGVEHKPVMFAEVVGAGQ